MIPDNKKTAPFLHKKYVIETPKGAMVEDICVVLCNLTRTVSRHMPSGTFKVYIRTRVLKHNYDKRPAQEYDFLIKKLHKLIKYPDHIYKNRDSKRGDFCFVKKIGGIKCFGSLEVIINEKGGNRLEIVTFFTLLKENYLNNYTLLWSWGDDNKPPS